MTSAKTCVPSFLPIDMEKTPVLQSPVTSNDTFFELLLVHRPIVVPHKIKTCSNGSILGKAGRMINQLLLITL